MMHFSIYKRLIERKLNHINALTGLKYETNFHSGYGGWNLYIVDPNTGAHFRHAYGFDYRKTSREMLSYLEGIELGLLTRNR